MPITIVVTECSGGDSPSESQHVSVSPTDDPGAGQACLEGGAGGAVVQGGFLKFYGQAVTLEGVFNPWGLLTACEASLLLWYAHSLAQ